MMETKTSLQTYLQQQEKKSHLHFITCGSVDDGKSTLIGRLLFETNKLTEDQLADLSTESKRYGTQQGALDFGLLLDGLSAEREQGITIDVAYRFFDSEKKRYTVIDAPGHEQYTKNMVTGASKADVAVILIDARHGIREQTKRHTYLVSLLGITRVILLINKMDLVNYASSIYDQIVHQYRLLTEKFNFKDITPIPVSALNGDNIVKKSSLIPWYKGLALLDYLDAIDLEKDHLNAPFRMLVQGVIRPNQDYRGYMGIVLSGVLHCGEKIKNLSSGIMSSIKQIGVGHQRIDSAIEGQSITVCLNSEMDISRGDILVSENNTMEAADQFQAHIVWMAEEALIPGRYYLLQCGAQYVNASVTRIKHQVNIHTFEPIPVQELPFNGIGLCNIKLDRPMVAVSYQNNHDLGSFILIDRFNHQTVGAGMIQFALQRSGNIQYQPFTIDKQARALLKNQKPRVFWFTGISGAGKTTLANRLEKKLFDQGDHTYLLDGDNVRQGLCKDLGFKISDRVENVRRVAEVAKLMSDAGLIVIVALISPFTVDRLFARSLFSEHEFVEIFVDTPLALAKARDTKGLYSKGDSGLLANFLNSSSEYERPEKPELIITTEHQSVEEGVNKILDFLRNS